MSTADAGHAPHVLYVAWGFPPSRGGGVYRALATANGFAEQGFRVTVLTAERETFLDYTGADTSLEELVDPRVQVLRVPFEWPMLETDVRRWGAVRALAPGLWRRARVKRDVVGFPEVGYGPWKKHIQAAAWQLHRRDPVDLVVATANPNVAFSVADLLHRRAGVPYVMDYRDAWMLDVFDGELLHPEGGRVARLEARLLAAATEVWFVNEPIRAWHQRRYPEVADRMHVVANGYDPDLAPIPRTAARPEGSPLRFGYIGTVSGKVPLREFVEGWRLARERSDLLAGAEAEIWGYLGFYSTPSPNLLHLVRQSEDVGVRYAGPLPKVRVREVYDTFDVALLILGAGRYVTSGKVFEYMASALPIVSVHQPTNAAGEILRDYPMWFAVPDLSPESVATAIEAAAEAARTASAEVRAACAREAEKFQRSIQLEPRVRSLAEGLALARSGRVGTAPGRGA